MNGPPSHRSRRFSGEPTRLMALGGRALLGITGLQARDVPRAASLAGAYALLLCSVYMLKPARNALFLSRVGVERLPLVMALVAIVGGAAAAGFARVAARLRVEVMVRLLFVFFATTLAAWWWGLSVVGDGVSVFGFYLWVNLYGQLTTAGLWVLAGSVVDARQARRVFPFVGALGIAGAVAGGCATRFAAERWGTVQLLPLCLLALTLGYALVFRLRGTPERPGPNARTDSQTIAADLRESRLLRIILAMTLLSALASALVDVQFNYWVDRELPAEDQQAAYFGRFFAYINAAAFVFQLALTSRVLRRVGVSGALLSLPAALGAAASAALGAPTLLGATMLKASDVGLRHSLYKSGLEMLFVPVPGRVRQRARLVFDAAVDNAGTAIGALGALAFAAALPGEGYRSLALMTLAVAVLWGWLSTRARAAHVEAFRGALETRQVLPEEVVLSAIDETVLETLRASLHSENDREVIYALDLIDAAADRGSSAVVLPLVGHESAGVRLRALRVLSRLPGGEYLPLARRALSDPDPEVRREAAAYIAAHTPEGVEVALAPLLDSPDAVLRAAALGACALRGESDWLRPQRVEATLALEGSGAAEARVELARALGHVPAGALRRRALTALTRDSDQRVVEAAIESAGLAVEPQLVTWLIERLGDRSGRGAAIVALSRYGERAVAELTRLLVPGTERSVVVGACRALSRVKHQSAVDALVRALEHKSPAVRQPVLAALLRLRRQEVVLEFELARLGPQLKWEVEYGRSLAHWAAAESPGQQPQQRLLRRALEEKWQACRDNVFRLLGLLYAPQDMVGAWGAARHPSARQRAHALEFLDNVLRSEDASLVVPFLESGPVEGPAPRGSLAAHLAEMVRGPDAWLRACAAYRALADPQLIPHVRAALADDDPIVRETARLVLDGSASTGAPAAGAEGAPSRSLA